MLKISLFKPISLKSFYIPFISILVMIISSFFFTGGESFYWLRIWEFVIVSTILIGIIAETQDREISINFNPIIFFYILFFITIIVSTIFSYYVWGSINNLLEMTSYLLLFFFIFMFKNENIEKIILSVFISLGFIDTIIVIVQKILFHSSRPHGMLKYANWNALFILYTTILIIPLLIELFKRNRKYFYTLLPIFILNLMAIVFSASRMLIILIPIVFFLTGCIYKRIKETLIIMFALLILILAIPNPVSNRILRNRNIYDMQRPKIWRVAYNIGMESPITGVGAGAFEDFAIMHNFPVEGQKWRYRVHAKIAHNQYLQFFADYGIPGILSFLIIAISGLFYSIKSIFYKDRNRFKPFWSIIFIIFLIHSFFDNPLYLPINAIVISISLAFIVPVRKLKTYIIHRKHTISYNLFFSLLILLIALITLHPFVSLYYANKAEDQMKITPLKAQKSYLIAYSFSPFNPQYAALYAKYWVLSYKKTRDMTDLYPMSVYMSIAMKLAPTKNFYRDLTINYLTVGNVNISNKDKLIMRLLEDNIKFNPYNPVYRLEYAKLIVKEYPDSAKSIIEKAIEYEPNFEEGKEFLKKHYGNPKK
jgi:O-antigen ligase